MKKIVVFFLAMAFSVGCDIIDDPFGGNPPTLPEEPGVDTVLRKVLIEEFTGHRCNNCPNAAAEIKSIKAIPNLGDRIIAIAIHAGPSNFTGTNPLYTTDFTTPEGNAWANFFGVAGLPTGMVSRNKWSPTGNEHLSSAAAWAGLANDISQTNADFKIEIVGSLSNDSTNASAEITVTPLTAVEGIHKLVVVITEDNIMASQTMPDYTRNDSYLHQHVFRTTFTSNPWGEEAFTPSDVVGVARVFQRSAALHPDWNSANLNVVAYIYSTVTQDIKQVEKIKL